MARLKTLLVAAESFSSEQINAAAQGDAPEQALLRAAKFLRVDVLTLDSLAAPPPEPAYKYLRAEKSKTSQPAGRVAATDKTLNLLATACESLAAGTDVMVIFGDALLLRAMERLAALPDPPAVVAVVTGGSPPEELKPLGRRPVLKTLRRVITFDPVRHLYVTERLRVPEESVELIPPFVDQRFFRAEENTRRNPELLGVVWSEFADRKLLASVVRGFRGKVKAVVRDGAALPPGITAVEGAAERRTLWREAGAVLFAEEASETTHCIEPAAEAMACATPIVLTETMPLQHVLRDGSEGICIAPGDTRAAMAALKQYAANPDLCAAVGAQARAKVEEMLSLSHFANRLSRICRAAAAKLPHREFYLAPNQVTPGAETQT